MSDTAHMPAVAGRGRRLWLVGVIASLAGAGIWGSTHREQHAARVALTGRARLLEFGMGICEQCKKMKPVMAEAARELGGRLEIAELDIRVEENATLGQRLGLRVIPTVILVDASGAATWRHEGFIPYTELAAEVGQRLPPVRP